MTTTPDTRTRWILDRLAPFAAAQGMTYLARQRQFRAMTISGFRALIVSLSHYATDSVLELHLGLRHDGIERTAFRYTNGLTAFAPDSLSLVVSTAKLRRRKYDRYTIAAEQDAEGATADLLAWLDEAAPKFWETHTTVSAIDAALNDHPETATWLMPNQQLRCLRGLVAARYAQRPDWATLIPVYRAQLVEHHAPPPLLDGYERLVDFLRTYTPN